MFPVTVFLSDLMYRKQGKCSDILPCDISAGFQSGQDHLVKLLPGQMADRIIIQLHCAGSFCAAGHTVHVLSADSPYGLQRIDHTVYSCHADLRIQGRGSVVDFLTAGALPLQDNVQKDHPLSGNTQPPFLQLL